MAITAGSASATMKAMRVSSRAEAASSEGKNCGVAVVMTKACSASRAITPSANELSEELPHTG